MKRFIVLRQSWGRCAMSLLDESARFTYSGHSPVPSPCGRYIAYLNGSNLAIRKTDMFALETIIKIKSNSRNNFLKVTQILWEPEYDGESNKIALLIDNVNTIKIYDVNDKKVDVSIIEDDLFGIEKFEWLPKGQDAIETAYDGSKQMVVFTKNELYAKIYSLDYSQALLAIEKPKFKKILLKPDSDIFTIITSKSHGYLAQNFINNGSSISHFNNIEIDSFLNLQDTIEWSPNGQWLLCNDSAIGEIKITLYSVFNQVFSKNEPLFSFRDDVDPLDAIDVKWTGDTSILVSDHHENIHYLDVSTGLSLRFTLQHKPQAETSKIWKQGGVNETFVLKQQSYKLPHIDGLPLHLKGCNKFLVNGDYLFVITKSMPCVVFIWDISQNFDEPAEILVTNSRVKDIITSEQNHNLLLIVNEDSVSLWHAEWTSPLNIPWEDDDENYVKSASLTNVTKGSIKLIICSQDSFQVLHVKLSSATELEGMNSEQLDIIRNGSPALIDDLTQVVELANGVQQSEWGHNHTNTIRLDDTFLNKRQNKLIHE